MDGSTLFIDNLSESIDSHELRRLFSNQGNLADAYIPRIQRRRIHGRFGFIEVNSWEQGDRLIRETNGKILGGQRISVKWAKYPKRYRRVMRSWQQRKSNEQDRAWKRDFNHKQNQIFNAEVRNPKQRAEVIVMGDEFVQRNKTAKMIKLDKAQENLEWLERSLICTSDIPRDVDKLRKEVQDAFPGTILVRDIGKFKFILTLVTKEFKEKFKTEEEERLRKWFSSISDWAKEDACQTRRLWLEMVGIPLQLWSEHNIKRIAENWGDVVHIEEDTARLTSFASAKVVIDTLCLSPIEDEVLIHVGNEGYRVAVFEAKTEFKIFHMGTGIEDISSSSMKVQGKKMKTNAENFSDEVAIPADMAHEDRMENLSQTNEQRDVAGEQSPVSQRCFKLDSNSAIGTRQTRLFTNGSNSSGTRTKTVSFSKKGDTEEVIKISLEDGVVNSRRKNIDDGTAVRSLAKHVNEQGTLSSGGSLPKGVERNRCESVEPPPGFEISNTPEIVKEKDHRKQLVVGRRVTRSQKQVEMNNSQDTTESMRKLAKEAIKIGNVLGIKVVSKVGNAKRIITDSIKEDKRKRRNEEKRLN